MAYLIKADFSLINIINSICFVNNHCDEALCFNMPEYNPYHISTPATNTCDSQGQTTYLTSCLK